MLAEHSMQETFMPGTKVEMTDAQIEKTEGSPSNNTTTIQLKKNLKNISGT